MIGRLTINLGLRTENETVPFYSTVGVRDVEPIHFSFGDKLAPRAGAAWDVTGDGRWKVHGSWGVFYDIFKLAMPQLAFGGLQSAVYSFKLETYDWPHLLNSPDCPPACPGGPAHGPDSVRTVVREHRPRPRSDADAGSDPGRRAPADAALAVSARFVHKQLDKAVEDIGSVDAEGNATYVIGNPGYLRATEAIPGVPFPKAVRDYDAVELVGAKAAGRQLGAHRELRLEPLVRQLLGALGVGRERPHRTQHRSDLRQRARRCSTATVEHSTDGWRPTVLTRPRRSSFTRRRLASTSASSSRWPAACR